MQNPFEQMVDEFTPEGQPSQAQGDSAFQQTVDDFTAQPLPDAPTAPGVPVPPSRPLTQTRTPEEYVKDELDAWWKVGWRNFLKEPFKAGKSLIWSLVQPYGDLDRPTGTSAWDRPAWIDAEIRRALREHPNLTEEQLIEQLKGGIPGFLMQVAPGWQDILAYPFSTAYAGGIKLQEAFGAEGENLWKPALAEEIAQDFKKWDFTNPQSQAELKKRINEGTAVVDYAGDLAFYLSLVGGVGGLTGQAIRGTGRTALLDKAKAATTPAQLAKINKRLGLPADTPQGVTAGFIKHKMSKSPFAMAMDKAAGYGEATNRFLNEGGEVPGWYNAPAQALGKVPGLQDFVAKRTSPETGRFQMKKGFADVIDPEMWLMQAGMRGISEIGTRTLSPHADMWNKRMDRLFKSYGIDPKQIPASLTTRSEAVQQLEGMQLNLDERAVTEKLQTALREFQAIAENIASEFEVDGDLTKMGQALEKAFEEYDTKFSTWARHYRNTIVPGSENVVADLTPIFQLRQDMEIERQRLHTSGNVTDEPTMTQYLDDLLDSMKKVGQNELTPENIEAMKAGEPIQPQQPKSASVGQVRIENQLGMPHRIASSGDYKDHYQVEYEIIPRGQVVTSHNLDGTDNVLFSQITQALGYQNLQPREFKGEFIRSIAADLQAMGYLADMRILDRGAPIVYKVPEQIAESLTGNTDPLFIMLAGNNRTLALDMARAEYPESAARYRTEMENEIGHYGYRPDDIQDDSSMLFRVLTDQDADLQKIVDQSNTTAIRLFDAGEQSQKDLEHLNQDLLQRLDLNYNGKLGDILQSTHQAEGRGESNADVIFEWLRRFNPADRGNMTTTEVAQTGQNRGQNIVSLTEQGVQRLVNALFRRTFDGAYGRKMMELFITRQDSDIKNIESGVIAALQDIADLQIGTRSNPLKYDPKYELSEDVAQAVVGAWQLIQEGQREGLSKTESLNKGRTQSDLPGLDRFANEEQHLILDIIGEAINNPSTLTGFIADYVAAVKEHGTPEGLFGTDTPPRSVLVEQLHHEYFFEETDGVREPEAIYRQKSRRGAEHMTLSEETYNQILKTGTLKPSTENGLIYFSAGGFYRGLGHDYGLIFDPQVLNDKYGAIPGYEAFWGDNKDSQTHIGEIWRRTEEAGDIVGTATYERVAKEYLKEKNITAADALEEIKTNAEIVIRGEIDIKDAMAVVENGEIKIITENTRGQTPDKWKFRTPRDEGQIPQMWDDETDIDVQLAEPKPTPVAPLELYYRSQMQGDVEAVRQQQKERQANDIVNEVQQLTLGFEGIEPEPVQLSLFQGLKRKAKQKVAEVKRAVAPVMKSKRLVSIEWEGFIPFEKRDAIVAELEKISGVTHTRDTSLNHERFGEPSYDDFVKAGEAFGYTSQDISRIIANRDDDPAVNTQYYQIMEIATEIARNEGRVTSESLTDIEIQISKQNIRTMETKLRKVLDILKANNAEINDSAGFHVHVDKTGMTPAEMANIIFAWAKYEWAITQQPGWQNQYSEPVSDKGLFEGDPKVEKAKKYLDEAGGDINAALRAAENDPDNIGVNAMSRASQWDTDVVEMEERIQKQLQESMKAGHSVMLSQTDHFTRLNVEGADAGKAHSIEFRQGEATLDLEQAMRNVVFGLHFVEKFKNEALKPGLRAPLSETMRRLQPDYQETDADYHQRLYAGEKFWLIREKQSETAETLLEQWDNDPDIAYIPQSGALPSLDGAKSTIRQLMATLPASTNSISVIRGTFNSDGTFTSGKDGYSIATLPLPQTFDTNPLTTFGEVYGSPEVDLRIRKTFINLLDRVSIPVIGMKIESPRELAIVAQALRANFESTRIFLYDSKKNEIVGTRVVSLGKTAASVALKPSAIKRMMHKTEADKFFYLHNHPGGEAVWSAPDLTASEAYKAEFGDNYIGQIVIDSGEFAIDWRAEKLDPKVTPVSSAQIKDFDTNDKVRYVVHTDTDPNWKKWNEGAYLTYAEARRRIETIKQSDAYKNKPEELHIGVVYGVRLDSDDGTQGHSRIQSDYAIDQRVKLTEEELGWNPEPREKLFGGARVGRNDPRFKGSQTREAKAYGEGTEGWTMDELTKSAIAMGKEFQTPKDWIVFAVINRRKRLVALLEAKGEEIKKRSKADVDKALRNISTQHGGDHVFIYIGEGDWYKSEHEAIQQFLKDGTEESEAYSADLVRLVSVDKGKNPFAYWGSLDEKTQDWGEGFITAQDMTNPTKEMVRRDTQPKPQQMPEGFARNPLPGNAFTEAPVDYDLKGKGQSRRSDGGATARRGRNMDFSQVLPPVTYGQVEAWRTYMRRQKEKHDIGTPEHTAAARMEKALTETLERTMLGFSPEMWQQMRKFYELYHRGAVSIRSKAAKAIRQNAQVGLVEGTSNYAQMARSLFSPGDTPQNVDLVFELIGGRDSEAGRQVRAIFLESLFEDARPKGATLEAEVIKERTKEQRTALEQAQAAVLTANTPAEVETAQQRVTQAKEALDTATEESRTMSPIDTVNPAGLSGKLETWIKKTGRGYKRKTLDAILGKQVVDALIDLRDMEQSLAQLKQGARGSRTAPWITRWLSNDARRSRLGQVIETLALAFSPTARGGMFIGGGATGITMAMTGNPIAAAGVGLTLFIAAWLGRAGTQAFMNYMQGKPVADRYLLEGTVVALDHVLTGTPILATPEQAQAHRRTISASDYSGMRSLSGAVRQPSQDREDAVN